MSSGEPPGSIVARARLEFDVPALEQAPAPELAAALRPDDTAAMTTRSIDDALVTTIERDSIGGLRTSVDDVLVNLIVAVKTAQLSERTLDTTTNE